MSQAGAYDANFRDTQAAIQQAQTFQKSKAETLLDSVGMCELRPPLCVRTLIARRAPGDKILGAKHSELVGQLQDPINQGLAEVKEHVSHFAENCKTLITVLDALSKAHPFIEGA